ncbi:MAG: long-chain fatty acid--CoA ligase [Promethearchaeota archaeon]
MELPDYIKNRIWKDFLPEGITLEINIPEDKSLIDVFEAGVKENASKVAYDYFGTEFTYGELDQLTRRFANALLNLGVKKGDVVALWLPNCPHFSICYFAALGLGATLTAISPLFVAREMIYQIEDSGAKYLIMIDRFFREFKKAEDRLKLEKLILVNVEGKVPEIFETDKIIHYNTLMELNPEAQTDFKVEINPKEDIAIIQYTGGTTGDPKGAELTHYNALSNLLQIGQVSDYMREKYIKGDLVGLSILPWYHVYGQICELLQGPLTGGKDFIFPTFDIPRIIETIKKKEANFMLGVPTMFINIISSPLSKDIDFSSLKYCNVGASAMPIEIAKEWEQKTGFPLGEGYGLSESTVCVSNSPPWGKKKLGSCGIPIASTLVGIIDENLNFLPIGEPGELVASGPQIMLGYHNRPEENKKVFFEAGGYRWLRTGDYAKLDEEGYIFLIDRVKDMIKYKGHSVYPREIEEVLYEHPAIQECAVIGVKDPKTGENIMVHIILKKEYTGKITEEEIISWSKENMAAYKYPRIVKFVRSLPKSAVGKVLRRVIRDKEAKKAEKSTSK